MNTFKTLKTESSHDGKKSFSPNMTFLSFRTYRLDDLGTLGGIPLFILDFQTLPNVPQTLYDYPPSHANSTLIVQTTLSCNDEICWTIFSFSFIRGH